jgi:hypothetical protein
MSRLIFGKRNITGPFIRYRYRLNRDAITSLHPANQQPAALVWIACATFLMHCLERCFA